MQLHNYLRMHRRKTGFTQKEIAFLIGSNQVGKISRYEKFYSIPQLKTILALEIIFQVTARELFAGLFEEVKKETCLRIEYLVQEVGRDSGGNRTRMKSDHLKRLSTQQKT